MTLQEKEQFRKEFPEWATHWIVNSEASFEEAKNLATMRRECFKLPTPRAYVAEYKRIVGKYFKRNEV